MTFKLSFKLVDAVKGSGDAYVKRKGFIEWQRQIEKHRSMDWGSNPYIWMRKESIEKERIGIDNVKEMEDET